MTALPLLAAMAMAGAADDRALIGQLDREVIALRQRITALQGQLATCSTVSVPNSIYTELVQVLQGQPAVVTRDGDNAKVTFQLDVLVSTESAALREEAEPLLDLVAAVLKVHASATATVVVYLDNGSAPPALRKLYPTSWELSAARAALVTREFTEGFGVSPHRFTLAARGDQDPVASNDTVEGRAQNRRVTLIIEPGPPEPGSKP